MRTLSSVATAGLFLLLPLAGAAAPAAAQETLRVPGLERPVEILRDRWGVAHIYAETEHDLFFAQGWNAARDRLFQFEIWRRQATGTVAEILGPREVERDIGARLFRYRGDMERELNHYHPRGKAIVEAFVAGVNAYIDETRRNPDLLPIEFELLGIRPGKWTPDVVISRHQGLSGNVRSELRYARAVARVGEERVEELEAFGPNDPDLALDPAIDPELLFDDDILDLYSAYRSGVRFRPEDVVAAHRGDDEAFARLAAAIPDRAHGSEREAIGSNNWVVSGRLTASGRTIMANDPHRLQQAPSLRYMVHLVGPGWNVAGGGEPEIPGVSIGHNEHGAWGLTVFSTDQEDLHVYETNPANPDQYRYKGRWETMSVIHDTVRVKGGAPVAVELKYTRHGPVVHEDPDNGVAYAVRTAWLEPGSAPYLASLRMDQARSWEEFRDACAYSRIPGENMVWADTAGRIGWQAVGIAPIRPHHSGLVPVPGDGRYEWDGYLPIKALPHDVDPERGFIATANEELVPDGYPFPRAVGYEWSSPFRGDRIREVLGSGRRHTLEDMMRLQQDWLSPPARTLVPLFRGLRADDRRVEAARQRLLAWDYVLDPESVAAAIYIAFERQIGDNAAARLIPADVREHAGGAGLSTVIEWLASPDGRFGDDPVAGRDALLLETLADAVDDLTERLGSDMNAWRYGQTAYKHALLRHPLSRAVDDATRERLQVGPHPRGGNSYTVNSTGWGDNQTSGASFRIIVEAGAWDRTVATNNPGQSGDPDDPHYRDLFDLWAGNRYFPLFYSREKVESVTESTTVLAPAPAAAEDGPTG